MFLSKNYRWTFFVCLVSAAAVFFSLSAPESWGRGKGRKEREDVKLPLSVAEIFFELNNTDGDLGIHALIGGDPWKKLEIEGPDGHELLDSKVKSQLRSQGMSEICFESAEPTFDQLPPEVFFSRFPEGEYEIEGETLEGVELESTATVTHLLPAPPENVEISGQAAAEDCDAFVLVVDGDTPVVISWDPVTHSHPGLGRTGEPVEIVRYQVVVEREEPTKLIFSVDLPPSLTEIEIPVSFIALSNEFKFVVSAREASGNQTQIESCFGLESVAAEPCFPTTVGLALCDPAIATFSLDATNQYYPLTVGSLVILEGEEDGDDIRVECRVLAETVVIDGVDVRILDHKSYINGEIHEVARNFYVEASDSTVCYFGEDVEFYEGGELVNTQGTWRAGVNGAKPGVIMPADPSVGQTYFQEFDEGNAQDMGRVAMVGSSVTISDLSFDDVVTIMDSNPLDDEARCVEEQKRYAPGVGEIQDTFLEVVVVYPVAQCFAPTLDVFLCDPESASFTLDSTNAYYPLEVGSVVILEGEDEGDIVRIERTVLSETTVIDGVTTHVLEHKNFVNGEIFEIARNFYVEATDGTVCYFGADVEFYEDGELLNTQGAWRAGVDGAKPGIINARQSNGRSGLLSGVRPRQRDGHGSY